ncbi:hypothetical protein BS78_04G109200 [Paspalum vaginatum]|nr:hypothetical protein BS78_04G109200 [Paspalum vaginatum]
MATSTLAEPCADQRWCDAGADAQRAMGRHGPGGEVGVRRSRALSTVPRVHVKPEQGAAYPLTSLSRSRMPTRLTRWISLMTAARITVTTECMVIIGILPGVLGIPSAFFFSANAGCERHVHQRKDIH